MEASTYCLTTLYSLPELGTRETVATISHSLKGQETVANHITVQYYVEPSVLTPSGKKPEYSMLSLCHNVKQIFARPALQLTRHYNIFAVFLTPLLSQP